MLTVRRIYLYLVAAISLVTVSWATIGLFRLILSEGIGQGQIVGLASLLATIIVGLPIFLFHWLMAQRLVAQNKAEQTSPLRQLYFYIIMAAGAAPIISNIYRLVDNGLLALVDGLRPDYYPYNLSTAEHLAALLVWGVVWVYIWRHARPLSERATALDINLTIRRIYLLALSLAGLVMVTWGATGLLRALMQLGAGAGWQTPVANFSAQLLVGALVWVVPWRQLQRDFFSEHPAEERSVLRKVYLYLAVFVYSVMALGSGTLLLKRLLELALGAPPSTEPLLSQLSLPAPLLVVGGLLWAYHWRALQRDASQAPEAPRQASVRRVYAYLVAAVGLAALLSGVVGLLTTLVDMLTTPATAGFSYYREQVALLVSLAVVGLPVWLLPWRNLQRLAVVDPQAESSEASAGIEARRSTARKIYLYFYVFVASLAIFGSVGWFIFHILTALLGADLPSDFITQVLDALVIALFAAGVWLYHWQAIRQDGQLEEQLERRRQAEIVVAVIDGDEGKLGQRLVRRFEQELPELQLKSLGLTPQAAELMNGEPVSAAALEMAHYVVGSWQALTHAEVAPLLVKSSALKLAIPLAGPNWLWATPSLSPDDYVQQVMAGLKQSIAGEEIDFTSGPDVGTIVAIVAGVALLLCIAGGLLVAGINMSF